MEAISQNYCHRVERECRDIDLERFLLKSKNKSDLLRVQEVMNLREGRTYTLEQVLEKIIRFYGKFVPF
jgi:hypothetical protein